MNSNTMTNLCVTNNTSMKRLIAVLATGAGLGFGQVVYALPIINNAPNISPIAEQTIFENSSLFNLPFTVGDVDLGDLALLVVTATSSELTLLPNGNIFFGGADADRTLTAVPLADETGFTLIAISALDPHGLLATRTFRLNVVEAASTVPDSGSSMLLAGLAFAGMALFRRCAQNPG
jgi:hypothetical protein